MDQACKTPALWNLHHAKQQAQTRKCQSDTYVVSKEDDESNTCNFWRTSWSSYKSVLSALQNVKAAVDFISEISSSQSLYSNSWSVGK